MEKKQKVGVIIFIISLWLMVATYLPLPKYIELTVCLIAIWSFTLSITLMVIAPIVEQPNCPVCGVKRFKPLIGKPAKYCWNCGYKFE